MSAYGMRQALPATLKDLRKRAGVSPETVGHYARLSAGQISRFESGQNWPREFDRIVRGYATALKVDDPNDLWKLAIAGTYEHAG
jgi:Helix-turn-helix domain